MTNIIEKLAIALSTYATAYTHETVADENGLLGVRTRNKTWSVYEIGEGNPFEREGQVWLGIFDTKEDAQRCEALANARAVLQTLHDNITPEMVEAAAPRPKHWPEAGVDPTCDAAVSADQWAAADTFQAMIATSLKGERA